MGWTWSWAKARERITTFLGQVPDITVKQFTRQADILDLPIDVTYEVDAVHLYIDIKNAYELIGSDSESEQAHRRALRFLNLHQRAVQVILNTVDAVKVDFHNQRLHAIVTHPLNDEATRIHKAIAIAQLVTELLQEVTDPYEAGLPRARVHVGIDSGLALAVTNGRRKGREPLFLGNPPNFAAKLAAGPRPGICITNHARAVIGLPQVPDERVPLTAVEITLSATRAGLGVTLENIRERWAGDLKNQPLDDFQFVRPTPPLRDFADLFDEIGPAQSRRIDSVTAFADLSGFTAYVARNIRTNPASVVQALHVIRSELHAVLHADFGGLKVRFIGDCIHGVLAEGERDTDMQTSITTAVLAAGGMRSSFKLAQTLVPGLRELDGIAIGVDAGPIALTRLGMKGDLNRCGFGRSAYDAEEIQQSCSGRETGLGEQAFRRSSKPVQEIFTANRRRLDLTYDMAVELLKMKGDAAGRVAAEAGLANASPAVIRAESYKGRSHHAQ